MDIHSREDIVRGLQVNFSALIDWVRARPDAEFASGPEGKWTEGQHIEHLIASAKPLNQGLRMPKIGLKGMFGTNNRAERDYDGLIARYNEKLALGGQATGRYIPEPVPVERKSELLDRLAGEGERLQAAMGKWKEDQLSKYLLPHPLLGKITVREMMFFTVYHMEHHLRILQRDMH